MLPIVLNMLIFFLFYKQTFKMFSFMQHRISTHEVVSMSALRRHGCHTRVFSLVYVLITGLKPHDKVMQ